MKLERLEELKKISTKNLIVKETLKTLPKSFYYNKYELEIGMALILFTLFGNTELNEAMNAEDINWIDFINDNFKLIEELKEGEYKEIYKDIFEEVLKGAKNKMKYNRGVSSLVEDLNELFSEENLRKLKDNLNKIGEEER